MLSLLLLLLVGGTFAQESGDFAQENVDQLIEAPNEGDNFNEDEFDEKDLSLSQESDQIQPDFVEKADDDACPDKGTCSYHIFFMRWGFLRAQRFCRRRRGNLSSIHTCGANHNVQAFLRRTCTNSSYV